MIEIYKITNLINNKCYIGQTKQGYFKRFQQHCSSDSLIGRAINKYGKENFIIEILESTTETSEANKLEHFYILKNNCVVPNGYNANEYGRLIGNVVENKSWYISLKPIYYNEILEKSGYLFYYIAKTFSIADKNLIIKMNKKTNIRIWSDLYNKIGCTSKQTQSRLKKFLTDNNLIVVENKVFKLNPDKFKIIY